ncbi:MAG: hypothetical protein U0L59_07435 [Faecalimonas sp.]|nr:hypothetical protein [Faecalimonas sp.]
MALMDEFKEERKAVLKNGTIKQKISYIWDYYKWHIMIPLIVVIALVSYIVNIVTRPDIILNGVMLNVYNMESQASPAELLEDFYKEQEIDSKEEEINLNSNLYYSVDDLNTNYQSMQVLMAWLSADQLDFITGDVASLNDLAYKDYFTDLRDYLSDEQFEKYKPYFLYIDYDLFLKRAEMAENMEDVSSIVLPDCTKPEEMKDPIPVMIDMSQSKKMTEIYGETFDVLALGITIKETNKDMTLKFLDYLME